jgi:hypothetical protein
MVFSLNIYAFLDWHKRRLPGLAQETYSTIPVGAVSNRTGTQHIPQFP